ncbi:spermatogenesis-associated protein 31A6-like isoform X2 [Bos javanicus]|uniref:spermatogenesis-associated protein 31A6-like isoform X2 n=1 Tax=Bos javanicus TaxID=9906 RepID=UPI002AA72F0A|nr:spermatogenesis-associated protein 31A6-like isoform X2 [Bos javanicus]
MMENLLFSLKSTFDIWLNSSFTAWAVITIITFLCGLGLFFLTLPYLKNNSSFLPPRKHGNIRKHRMERRGRSRSIQRNGALKFGKGKDEDHTLPRLRVCDGNHGGPQGPFHPCPRGEGSPAQSTHLPWVPEPRQRENIWSSSKEGQATRGNGASKKGSFTSPQCK